MISWLVIAGLVMPASAGKKAKKKAEAAAQESAEMEDSSCMSDVGCIGNNGPKPEITCPNNARHTGTLTTPSGLELDLSGATAGLRLEHKLDIDAHEDRCITDVWIDAHHGDSGCALTLHYKANPKFNGRPGSARYVLVSGKVIADSFCPGWDDVVEDKYVWTPRSSAPNLVLSKDDIDDRTARESCVSISAQLDGTLKARRLMGSGVELDVSKFSVGGTFPSVGDTAGVCAGAPKPEVTGLKNTAFAVYRSYSFSETDDADALGATSVGVLYSRSLTPKLAVYGALGFLNSDDFNEKDSFTHIAVGGQLFVWGDYFTMGAFADLELGRTSSSYKEDDWGDDYTIETTINMASAKLGFRYVSEYGVVGEIKAGVPVWSTTVSFEDEESDPVTRQGIEAMLAIGYTF